MKSSRELNLSADVVQWLLHGERGISSETIVSWLTGFPVQSMCYPADPDDLRRCRLLLDACPELIRPFMERMPECSEDWARLVAIWDDLCELMDYEIEARRKDPKLPWAGLTYHVMKRALRQEATCHACQRDDVALCWMDNGPRRLEVHGVTPTEYVKVRGKWQSVGPRPPRCDGSTQEPAAMP